MNDLILYQDEDMLILDKPEGFHVHKPEDRRLRIPKEKILIYKLRDQFGEALSPVHRLDAATSGCLIWAKHRQAASHLCAQFLLADGVQKTYYALVRGWIKEDKQIDLPLQSDSSGDMLPSVTEISVLGHYDLPFRVGKRSYPSARYSLVLARPKTGRYRQIRRHLKHLGHPIVGDSDCGDLFHNRFFKNELGISGMFLIAKEIHFHHPRTGEPVRFESPWSGKWVQWAKFSAQYRLTSPLPCPIPLC